MTSYKSDFIQGAQERGFVHQCTNIEALDGLAAGNGPLTGYIGFDCTGSFDDGVKNGAATDAADR